jgi:hypothetical protein
MGKHYLFSYGSFEFYGGVSFSSSQQSTVQYILGWVDIGTST